MRILISYCPSNIPHIEIRLHSKRHHNLTWHQKPNFLNIYFSYIFLRLWTLAKYELPSLLGDFCAIDRHISILYLSNSWSQDPTFCHISIRLQNSFQMDNSTFFFVHLLNHFENYPKIYFHFWRLFSLCLAFSPKTINLSM